MTSYSEPNQYECDNCGYKSDEKDFPEAKDLHMRLTPGGIATTKECPDDDCGALAFPVNNLRVQYRRLLQIERTTEDFFRNAVTRLQEDER